MKSLRLPELDGREVFMPPIYLVIRKAVRRGI